MIFSQSSQGEGLFPAELLHVTLGGYLYSQLKEADVLISLELPSK